MSTPRSTQVSTTAALFQTLLAQGGQGSSSGRETSSVLPGKHTLGSLSAEATVHTTSHCTIVSQSGFKTLRASPASASQHGFDSSGVPAGSIRTNASVSFPAFSTANRPQDLRLQAGQTETASQNLANEDDEVPDPFPVFSWMTITTSAAIVIPVVPASTDTHVVTSTTTNIQVTTAGTVSNTLASVTIASSQVSFSSN